MKAGRRHGYIIIAASVLVCAVSIIVFLISYKNFHAISPNQAYRSRQLNASAFERYKKKYAIRSVINLRGPCPLKPWYKKEIAICQKLGLQHYDVQGLSSDLLPQQESIAQLIEAIKTAPRPVLIHCKNGADRTGLAAALWKVIVDRKSFEEAQKQLSLKYGHMPFGKRTVMNTFFKQWYADTEHERT